jgi:hypothetical protein
VQNFVYIDDMNYETIKQNTKQKFETGDFKPGDIFSELLSYWEVIIGVEGDNLTIISGQPTNGNLKLKTLTKEEFKYYCQYKHRDGYWIDFMKNNPGRVSDYIEAYIEQMKLSKEDIREFKLDLLI